MKESRCFDRGASKENFDKLAEFMDKNDFSCADFLACVCANISSYPQNEFETSLFVAGHEFNIKIERKQNVCH